MSIYYLCPDDGRPIGGIKQIYRHVELLNALGHEAYVLHQRRGFICRWFEHKAPTAYLHIPAWQQLIQSVKDLGKTSHPPIQPGTQIIFGDGTTTALSDCDIVVVPETYVIPINRLVKGIPFVIFNQNPFMTIPSLGPTEPHVDCVYQQEELLGVMVVSDYSIDFLRYPFPNMPVFKVRNALDSSLFYAGSADRPPRLAYMPRRANSDLQHIFTLLRLRGVLDGWELLPITNMDEAQVGEAMRSSALFLSGGYREGFGLPAAEAAACACTLVGYHGFGGLEIFDPQLSYPINPDDILRYAQAVEDAINHYHQDRDNQYKQALELSKKILSTYNQSEMRNDLLTAWSFMDSGEATKECCY